MAKLSVLMPVFNEARTLRTIIDRVLAAPIDMEIELIAVDDGSSDGSGDILESLAASDPRIRCVRQAANRGKGAAIRRAIDEMTGDIAIIQDADLEYDPADYPRLVRPIADGRADAVYGSRFAASGERRVLLFWHSLGNKLLTALSNMANDLNLTDMETCYKAVRSDLLRSLRLTSERFGFEPELTARLAQAGSRIYEVPISYHGRTYAEGKSIGWRDGVEALWLIVKFRFLDTHFSRESSVTSRQSIGPARAYRRWLLGQFEPHLGDRVLELYAGPGHYTAHLLDRKRLVAVDPDPVAVSTLSRRYGHMENVEFLRLDPLGSSLPDGLDESFSTVVCFDGLQRSSRPDQVLEKAREVTRPGGTLLVSVPHDPALFGDLDARVGHLRRFSERELTGLMEEAGWEVLFVRDFNRLGRFGWGARQVTGGRGLTRWIATAFNLLTPVARALERWLRSPGLSLIAVARRS